MYLWVHQVEMRAYTHYNNFQNSWLKIANFLMWIISTWPASTYSGKLYNLAVVWTGHVIKPILAAFVWYLQVQHSLEFRTVFTLEWHPSRQLQKDSGWVSLPREVIWVIWMHRWLWKTCYTWVRMIPMPKAYMKAWVHCKLQKCSLCQLVHLRMY